jgi:hypothetical protein
VDYQGGLRLLREHGIVLAWHFIPTMRATVSILSLLVPYSPKESSINIYNNAAHVTNISEKFSKYLELLWQFGRKRTTLTLEHQHNHFVSQTQKSSEMTNIFVVQM